jgi:hypothetical protein
MTYTPGPWFYDGECFICSDGPDIASVVKAATGWEANARLIAAAPDLLVALVRLFDAADQNEVTFADMNVARAAIAKATGGES